MKTKLIFKTTFDFIHVLWICSLVFVLTQYDTESIFDFSNNTSWLLFVISIVFFWSFRLFFVKSFEFFENSFNANYYIFSFRNKAINLDEIVSIEFHHIRIKGVWPWVVISTKNGNFKLYYFLISTKSIKGLVAELKKNNINASLILP